MIFIMQQHLNTAKGKAVISCNASDSETDELIGFDCIVDYNSTTIEEEIIEQAVLEFAKKGIIVKLNDCKMLK